MRTNAWGELLYDQIDPHYEEWCNEMQAELDRWQFLFSVTGCHKWFRDSNGKIAVADYSGHYPNQTDDGVLYLDTEKRIVISRDGADENVKISLIDAKGNSLMLGGTNRHEADVVSRQFGLKIEDRT